MLAHIVKFQVRVAALTNDRRDRGATAVEYGLMVALIAAFIAVAVGLLGVRLDALFRAVTAAL